MADEKTVPDNQEYLDDGTKNPKFKEPAKEDEGAAAGTENKDGKIESKEDEFDDTVDPNKPPEIPLRKFNAQHIIARKDEKIKKLESKLKEGDEGYVPPEEGEDDDQDIETRVKSSVEKALKPVLDILISKTDEDELQALVKAEPEASKYANHIRAYMTHDAYKGVSPTVIFHHLAWQNAQAIGAKKKKVADLEAGQAKSGGRNLGSDQKGDGKFPTPEEIAEMSEANFQKMQEEALQK
jgi:hypothetical protein